MFVKNKLTARICEIMRSRELNPFTICRDLTKVPIDCFDMSTGEEIRAFWLGGHIRGI
jgi:hypothetical protein